MHMAVQRVDTAVVGLGVMGAATLRELSRRGVEALGIERHWPTHPFGSSHGDSRIIRQAYYEHPDYVPLVQEAWRAWEELARTVGWPLLLPTGGLMIGRPASALVGGARLSADTHGLSYELLEFAGLRGRFPALAVDADDVAVFERSAGYLNAELALTALVHDAMRHGARVKLGAEVAALHPTADGVRIQVGADSVVAHRAVVAAGPWTKSLLPDFPAPLTVERQVLAWFPVRDAAPYQPDRFPIFMREEPDGTTFYGFPTQDGRTLKVARHHGGATVDPDRVDRHVTAADLEDVRSFVARALPGLSSRPVRAAVCLYTNTPDRHFAVGPAADGIRRIVVLAGFSGHGFKFAPAMARIAADAVLDQKPVPPLFRPDRPR
jgi:sarcosine oxidase